MDQQQRPHAICGKELCIGPADVARGADDGDAGAGESLSPLAEEAQEGAVCKADGERVTRRERRRAAKAKAAVAAAAGGVNKRVIIIPTAAAAATATAATAPTAVETEAVVAAAEGRARQQRDTVLRDDARELPQSDDVGTLADGDARGLGDFLAREAVLRPRRALEELGRRKDAAELQQDLPLFSSASSAASIAAAAKGHELLVVHRAPRER